MDENEILLRVTERFVRTGSTTDEQIKVIRLPDNKSSFVEYIGVDGRSIYLNEFHVDGKIILAGFSSRTQTVFLSSCN
jgi:uncharacterized protein YqfA (UPF0365 family)